MNEIVQWWRDGLLTDAEALLKIWGMVLEPHTEILNNMMTRDADKYWYILRHRIDRVKRADTPPLLLSPKHAAAINAVMSTCDHEWYSTFAERDGHHA